MKSKLGAVPEMDTVFRKSCSSCHVVPDPELPADGLWLAGLETTLCRSLTPELRDGLTEFLRDAEGLRPNALTSHAEPAPGQASIAANLEGEVFLRADSGASFRLAWGPDEAGQKRVIAPGKYQLYGYRVFRRRLDPLGLGQPAPDRPAGRPEPVDAPRARARGRARRGPEPRQAEAQHHGPRVRAARQPTGRA